MTYRVLDVSSWELAGHETVGRTEHPWLRDASTQQLHLWKPVTAKRLERREHLAEKLASELARAVGVPCATVELAVRAGVPGCVSRNVQPSGWSREFGADLLLDLDPAFRATVKRHATYTVTNVLTVLSEVGAPQDRPLADAGLRDAFDAFTGYLVFDAPREGRESTLFEVATDALQLCSAPAKQHWLERVAALSDSSVIELVAAVPGLSAPLRTLVPMLVASARRRILDAR